MGQNHSTAIEFKDNYTASDVSSRGRIKATKTCSFTQYSERDFGTDVTTSITCKVYDNNHDTIAFGLVPVQQVDGCKNNLVGDREIYGSIGCHVTRDTVDLVKGGERFFNGSFEAGTCYTIRLKIRNGSLAFFVNGHKVRSEELDLLSYNGRYKLGVSMVRAGQQAEVYFDCAVTFADIWSAGDVSQELLTVQRSTNFTFFSEQIITPRCSHKIVAKVHRNCGNSVGLGVVPVDCKGVCQTELVGMKPGMIGCIIKNGNIFVAVNGDVKFAADVNTADPCVLVMNIDRGRVSFEFDGREVNCDELKHVSLTGNFRVGVGMSAAGQAIEMRGDGTTASSLQKDTPKGDKERLGELIGEILKLAVESSSNSLSWKDNMRSIDCDSKDQVAVCTKKFTATLHSKCVINAAENNSVDIRVLGLRHGQLMMVGVMDENTNNHSCQHLGSSELRGSLGLTNRGDLILKGATKATGRGFHVGDLISLSFNNERLSIKVNGIEAIEELRNYSFSDKFRWAVSFTDIGQAVKIGREDLTAEEAQFCREKGVLSNSAVSESVITGNTVITEPSTTVSSMKSSGSKSTVDNSIQGCFIDAEDLTFGGKSLGEGSFGAVFRGKWDGADVAIKKIEWQDDENQRREIAVGRQLTHPNIATITGWSKKDMSLLVVMPLFRKGSLADRLARLDRSVRDPIPSQGGHLGFEFTSKIALGLLRAIKYMANRQPNPMIHRDIKPANVLLDEDENPMLTDFGTARSLNGSTSSLTVCGTPMHFAPEQAEYGHASPATDVHAVTLIIYETLCVPRKCRKATQLGPLMKEIQAGTVPPMHDVPREWASVMKPAFAANPSSRPTAAQMVKSFTGMSTVYSSA